MLSTDNNAFGYSEASKRIMNNPEKQNKIIAFEKAVAANYSLTIQKAIAKELLNDRAIAKVNEEKTMLRNKKRSAIKEYLALQVEIERKQKRLNELNSQLSSEDLLSYEEKELRSERFNSFKEREEHDLSNRTKDRENKSYKT